MTQWNIIHGDPLVPTSYEIQQGHSALVTTAVFDDNEVQAMFFVLAALESVPLDARQRIVNYVQSKVAYESVPRSTSA